MRVCIKKKVQPCICSNRNELSEIEIKNEVGVSNMVEVEVESVQVTKQIRLKIGTPFTNSKRVKLAPVCARLLLL